MKLGQYVRCPIVLEEADSLFPRSFVLGQITEINELSEEVSIQFHDLTRSKQYYEHAFAVTSFPVEHVHHCPAAKGAPVMTPDGKGVILSRYKGDGEEASYYYYVLLYDGKTNKYTEESLEIEYSEADYSPLLQMRDYELQNPTWYANRLQVSRNMHMINNTVYGFKILAGCRTFLMQHQISTIVRTFETRPIRYMLADEVGLGKTIEACSIVKIMCNENKCLRVLYIVPEALVQQWCNELKYKFNINTSQSNDTVEYADHFITALEAIHEGSPALDEQWDLLIVDETHRLLTDSQKYKLILALSSRIENVLFLSATPIQDRQTEYLRLLTLLQPQQYQTMTIDRFSDLVAKQKIIQRRVNAMLRHLSAYHEYKEDTYDKLTQLSQILHDTHLNALIEKIDFRSADEGLEATEQALAYISENYRIERKVIRNRRTFIREKMAQRRLVPLLYAPKNNADNYNEQNTYNALLQYLTNNTTHEASYIIDVAEPLLSAMFSSPWALQSEIARLGIHDADLTQSLSLWVAQSEDEEEATNSILDETPELIKGRLLHAVDYLEQEVTSTDSLSGKVVVFTKYRETLNHFTHMLSMRNIKAVLFCAGMTRVALEDSVYAFQNDPQCRVIICDETGGEGRNFQNADWIIQLDLPWTANVIEQRIGRLDRLGRDGSHMVVNSVILTAKGTIDEQLFTIWNNGMHLFEKSLSGLEIITNELNKAISEALLSDFYNGLANALDDIVEMAEDAEDTVEEEQLYDSGAVIYKPLSQAVEQMLSTYQGGENNVFQDAMLGWSTQAGLSPRGTNEEQVVEFAQEMFSPRAAIQSLLIPPNWKHYQNTSIVRHSGKILGTFDRATAIKREDLLFFAPGDPVFNSIIGNAVDNGRGRCCALIVRGSFDYYGFICIYNVEPDVNRLLEANVPLQLLSQFRMYLPMRQITVFIPLTESSKSVPEQDLQNLLLDKHAIMNATHLGSRGNRRDSLSNIESFIVRHPMSEWQRIVAAAEKAAHTKALSICQEESDLKTAKSEMSRIIHGYESEALYLDKSTEIVVQKRAQYSVAYHALEHPHVYLDSMSLMKVNCNNEVL